MAVQKPGEKKKDGQAPDEDDQTDKERSNKEYLGPPGFYDADLEKYYRKFEGSRKARQDFKKRMQDKMSFTNSDWNSNVERLGTTHGTR